MPRVAPPRPRSERLLNRRVLGRVYGFVGLIVGVAGLLALLGWGLARAYQPARAARLPMAITEHPTFQRGEAAPEVMTYRS